MDYALHLVIQFLFVETSIVDITECQHHTDLVLILRYHEQAVLWKVRFGMGKQTEYLLSFCQPETGKLSVYPAVNGYLF